jgi:hypothetical protein
MALRWIDIVNLTDRLLWDKAGDHSQTLEQSTFTATRSSSGTQNYWEVPQEIGRKPNRDKSEDIRQRKNSPEKTERMVMEIEQKVRKAAWIPGVG